MKATITGAELTHSKDAGYVGKVLFRYADHKAPYELALNSDDLRDWSYSLFFAGEPGSEEDIIAVEEAIEEDDELFDALVEAAKAKL